MTNQELPLPLSYEQIRDFLQAEGALYSFPLPLGLANKIRKIVQWDRDQCQAEIEAKLQEARDQQLDECCKWLASNDRPAWAACLRSAFRPTVDDSEAADAARMRWMLQQGKVTSFDTATCRPVFYGKTEMNDARREIDKRMAQDSGNT